MGCFPLIDDLINGGNIPVSQKYISGLRAGGFYMIDAIIFFFRTGKFMFFDDALVVVVHKTSYHQTGLTSAIHYQGVDIVTRFLFAKQYAVGNEFLEIGGRLIIHFLCMNIGAFGKVDLGFSDAQK